MNKIKSEQEKLCIRTPGVCYQRSTADLRRHRGRYETKMLVATGAYSDSSAEIMKFKRD